VREHPGPATDGAVERRRADLGWTNDEAEQRRADREWLGLRWAADTHRATVTLGDRHVTHLGRMYGGAGTALAAASIEAAAERRLLWATVQFVASPRRGETLELRAEVLAAGRRSSQIRIDAYTGDTLVFHGVGAAGDPVTDIPDVTVPPTPAVPSPAQCAEIPPPVTAEFGSGFFGFAERRRVLSPDGPERWWMRVPGRLLTRPALLPLAADFVPALVMRAIGERGAGTSLDNTLRVGPASDSEWVLVDGAPEQSAGGYGHGGIRLWSAAGSLVATASQTAALWRM
jgi:acyl-CoA thioesterase